jgi:ketosteroid isomerase-like protein
MTSFKQSAFERDIEIIRNIYYGINQNDIDAVVDLMDVDITRIEPEDFPKAGTYRGHHDVRQHLTTGRSTWAEGRCDPIDFFTAGNKIVVTVHIKVRLKDHSEWIDAWIADGFFEWAGIVVNH